MPKPSKPDGKRKSPNATSDPLDSLTPIQRDILRLVHRFCYEGFPATKMATVDPDDRRLCKLIDPSGHCRITYDAMPVFLIAACIYNIDRDKAAERWGDAGRALDRELRDLKDRQLIDVVHRKLCPLTETPPCGAFHNPFDEEREIVSAVKLQRNVQGESVPVWEVPFGSSAMIPGTFGFVKLTPLGIRALEAPTEPTGNGQNKTTRERNERAELDDEERDVLQWTSQGYSQAQMAEWLGLNPRSGRVSRIKKKAIEVAMRTSEGREMLEGLGLLPPKSAGGRSIPFSKTTSLDDTRSTKTNSQRSSRIKGERTRRS